MNKNRFCALILSAFISTTFITGCGASGAEAGASGTQETSAESTTTQAATADNATDDAAASDGDSSLVVAVCEEPEKGFDPCVKWPYSGDPIFQSMLYAYDSEGNVVEDLSTGYTANEDQTEIEVTIRDDAQFSDGEHLTADDVVFSYTKIPETNTWVDYSTLDHVEKVDDYTVKFYLKRSNIGDILSHLFLPALTLSLSGIANIAFHTRQKLLEIYSTDYVLFARARGESSFQILKRHGLKNVLIPAITLQFGSIGEIFGGSVLVEKVFSYPGLGGAVLASGTKGDIPLLLGITLISAVIVILGNMMADIICQLLDHRIGIGGNA